MKYELITLFGKRRHLKITKHEYDETEQAKRILILLLGIEEKFDFLLANYTEYERELMNLSLEQMLYRSHDWFALRDDVQAINLRISNLLSSARLYIDQSKHDVSTGFGEKSRIYESLTKKMSQEYNSSLGYRSMEAIRNYTQHRNVPVQGISYRMTRKNLNDPVGPAKTVFRTTPLIKISELKADRSIKASLIDEFGKTRRQGN